MVSNINEIEGLQVTKRSYSMQTRQLLAIAIYVN